MSRIRIRGVLYWPNKSGGSLSCCFFLPSSSLVFVNVSFVSVKVMTSLQLRSWCLVNSFVTICDVLLWKPDWLRFTFSPSSVQICHLRLTLQRSYAKAKVSSCSWLTATSSFRIHLMFWIFSSVVSLKAQYCDHFFSQCISMVSQMLYFQGTKIQPLCIDIAIFYSFKNIWDVKDRLYMWN